PLPELSLAHYDAVAQQDLDPVEPHALGVVAVIVDQDATHVVRMVEHPGVRAAAGGIDAVRIAQLGIDRAHAIERICRRADVEALVGFGWQESFRRHEAGNSTRRACFAAPAEPATPYGLCAARARGVAAAAHMVAQLPHCRRGRRRASGRGTGPCTVTAALLLASTRTVLRALSVIAESARSEGGVSHQPFRGW